MKKTLDVNLKVKVEYKTAKDLEIAKEAIRNRMYRVNMYISGFKIETSKRVKISK
jgi:hypothetical protein